MSPSQSTRSWLFRIPARFQQKLISYFASRRKNNLMSSTGLRNTGMWNSARILNLTTDYGKWRKSKMWAKMHSTCDWFYGKTTKIPTTFSTKSGYRRSLCTGLHIAITPLFHPLKTEVSWITSQAHSILKPKSSYWSNSSKSSRNRTISKVQNRWSKS